MKKFNVPKFVTILMVIFFTFGIYFILPDECLYAVIEQRDRIKFKIIVSVLLSGTLSTILININPRGFFDLRKSFNVMVTTLIIAIIIVLLLFKLL